MKIETITICGMAIILGSMTGGVISALAEKSLRVGLEVFWRSLIIGGAFLFLVYAVYAV